MAKILAFEGFTPGRRRGSFGNAQILDASPAATEAYRQITGEYDEGPHFYRDTNRWEPAQGAMLAYSPAVLNEIENVVRSGWQMQRGEWFYEAEQMAPPAPPTYVAGKGNKGEEIRVVGLAPKGIGALFLGGLALWFLFSPSKPSKAAPRGL